MTLTILVIMAESIAMLLALQPLPATPLVNISPVLLPDLQALGLEYHKKTGAERLSKAIKTHLDKNPTLANHRFQVAYRSNNTGTGGGGKAACTSADKPAEDAAEGEKPPKDPTGPSIAIHFLFNHSLSVRTFLAILRGKPYT